MKNRYAYIKYGDVVTQSKQFISCGGRLPTSGPDAFVSDFLKYIDKNPVILISSHKQNADFQYENIHASTIGFRYGKKKPLNRLFFETASFYRTFLMLLKFKPDKIICGRTGSMLWAAFLISRLRSTQMIHSRHEARFSEKKKWYLNLISTMDRYCILNSTAVVCHGPFLKQKLLEMGISLKSVYEFDVDFSDILKGLNTDTTAPPSASEEKTIIYIGRLETYKGVFDLLEAVSELIPRHPDIRLIYTGSGSQLHNLEKMATHLKINQNVCFTGKIKHSLIGEFLKKARISVTPTQGSNGHGSGNEATEARCMSAMESVVFGTPVIAPDSGPFPYLIKHSQNGLLYKTGSVADLKDKINSVLDDENLYMQLRKGAVKSGLRLKHPPQTFSEAVSRAFQ